MYFYYIRHADPIYNPDSITPHGEKQAELLSERLVEAKIDEVYASSSNRAVLTAKPTADKLGLKTTVFDWAREDKAAEDFGVDDDGKWTWCFFCRDLMDKFNKSEVVALNGKWYEHEYFKDYSFKRGIERINRETDAFFEKLGYVHDRENRRYKAENPTDKRIAFFAHGGFAMAFLSSILDIPYNIFCLHFSQMSTTCVTVIKFDGDEDNVVPKIVEYGGYPHLYKGDLKPYHYLEI